MTREEFIEGYDSLSELEQVDYEYGLYVFSDYEIVDQEDWEKCIDDRISDWYDDWHSLRNFLNSCYDHDGYDYYRVGGDYDLDECGIDEEWAEDLIADLKEVIIERMDDGECWDEEDTERTSTPELESFKDFSNCKHNEMQENDNVLLTNYDRYKGVPGIIVCVGREMSLVKFKDNSLWVDNSEIERAPDREIETNDINLGDVFFSARGIAELNNLARLEREQEKEEEEKKLDDILAESLELELPF